MKKSVFTILALTMAATFQAQAFNVDVCLGKAVTNLEMKQCVAEDLKQADNELNKMYAKVKTTFLKTSESSAERLKRLVAAQKAWITFRDANCNLQATEMLGGSGEGLLKVSCLAEMTKKRTEELRSFTEPI